MSGPLKNIKVIDLTSVAMGPYCTLLMGDMGADIVKVERPEGDILRNTGPSNSEGMGSLFLNLNRNKRSVVLNLKDNSGRKALLELIKTSDVFVHSLRPRTMQKLGISYDDMKTVNPEIIYCGMYGYSQKGTYRHKPAYDDVIQAVSGVAAAQEQMTGYPQYVSSFMADKNTGLIGVSSILAALLHREKNGTGQEIEVPMFESMVSYNMVEHMYGETFSPPLGDYYYKRTTSSKRKPYKTIDGYIALIIYTDKHWEDFFEISGLPELKHDQRFMNIQTRTTNVDYVYGKLEEIIKTKRTEDWLKLFSNADIPCVPVKGPAELMADPHLKEIEFFNDFDHPTEGRITEISFPVNFSETNRETNLPAPKLGEHTKEILEELGY